MVRANVMENLLEREREILRVISLFSKHGLKFAVVGGYAVAAFRRRFSVDLDVIIKKEDMEIFEVLLKENGYAPVYSKDIASVYGEEFRRFEKLISGLPVDMDLLINGLVSRATGASWGFDYIIKESVKGSIEVGEFVMANRELLIAMKLHSGRTADIRDIVALAEGADFEGIKRHALRGDKKKLIEIIDKGVKYMEGSKFQDAFKGVFGATVYKKESVEAAKRIMLGLKSYLS